MFDSIIEINILTGVIFMVAGYLFLKNPPKEINSLYGYRTKRAMKTQERWDFSQDFAAKEMMNLGFFLALSSFIGKLVEMDFNTRIWVGLAFTVFTAFVLYLRVERALKEKFPD
jgi:uncharacterized membrane protein